jgi:FkbM family methyltransferase
MAVNETEQFAAQELRVFRLMANTGFSPQVVFDIGASNGSWSHAISEVFPGAYFHLFEPLAEILPDYQEILGWILRQHPDWHFHAIALGEETKNTAMSVHSDGFASTIIDTGEVPGFRRVSGIPQYRLDVFVEERGLPLPDLIKLDTQGSELAILKYATRCLEKAGVVFTESWLERGYGPKTPLLSEMLEFLNGHGFALVELGHRFYHNTHELYGLDAFFVKRSILGGLAPNMPTGTW